MINITPMISFPNAKINIGLNIIEKRPDGFHNLESCFYPIHWCDVLEIIPAQTLHFSSSGIIIPSSRENNLCLKAYHLLQKDYNIPPVNIHLHKVIPIGAGLGGGSSDGAFALKMINEIFELSLSNDQLETYAGQLGSDCPFFIQNRILFVTGTGNVFDKIAIDLRGKHLVVVKPNIHLSTAEAYSGINPHYSSPHIKDILEHQPMTKWKTSLVNDFEESIFPNNPEIEKIKELLYHEGALYASMTGSGAAVFGIFNKEKKDLQSENSITWKGFL